MEEVLNISDREAVMHEGRVTGILERNECTEENVTRLAGGVAIRAPTKFDGGQQQAYRVQPFLLP